MAWGSCRWLLKLTLLVHDGKKNSVKCYQSEAANHEAATHYHFKKRTRRDGEGGGGDGSSL